MRASGNMSENLSERVSAQWINPTPLRDDCRTNARGQPAADPFYVCQAVAALARAI